MNRRLAAAGLGVAVLVAAVATAFVLIHAHQAPAAFALSTPATSTDSASLAGAWKVAPGSEAGYRAREKFVNQPNTTEAVARTSSVSGNLRIAPQGAGYAASGIDVKVDLAGLKSEDKYAIFQTYQRDFFVRSIYLQSDVYPTAEFKAGPVLVPADQGPGPVHLAVSGALSVHGITKPETANLEVQVTGKQLEAVGTIDVDMRDFNIDPPDISFTKAEPTLVIEFRLLLARS